MIFCGPLSTTRYLCIEKAMHYFPYPDVTLRHHKNWPGRALPWQNFEKMKYFLVFTNSTEGERKCHYQILLVTRLRPDGDLNGHGDLMASKMTHFGHH